MNALAIALIAVVGFAVDFAIIGGGFWATFIIGHSFWWWILIIQFSWGQTVATYKFVDAVNGKPAFK